MRIRMMLAGLLLAATTQAQSPVIPAAHCLKAEEKLYTYVEQMPEFPGGRRELEWFLQSNYRMPKADPSVSGRIFVQFAVTSDGRICDPKILKGMGGDFDQEALRVVAAMPNWYPGRQNGAAVPVSYPVVFSVPPRPVAPRPTPLAFKKVDQPPRLSGAKQGSGTQQTPEQALTANGLPNDHAPVKVPVRLVIDTAGVVTQAVAGPAGLDPYFRELAEKAGYRLRWEPGRQQGRPVWVAHEVLITLQPTYVTARPK